MQNNRPILTVDAIVMQTSNEGSRFLLIKRKNPPYGWALPGGLVDVGETVEQALVRELKEETCLETSIEDIEFLFISSEPNRDPRFHAVSLAYYVSAYSGEAKAADDAAECGWFSYEEITAMDMAFDHKEIITKFVIDLIETAEKCIG